MNRPSSSSSCSPQKKNFNKNLVIEQINKNFYFPNETKEKAPIIHKFNTGTTPKAKIAIIKKKPQIKIEDKNSEKKLEKKEETNSTKELFNQKMAALKKKYATPKNANSTTKNRPFSTVNSLQTKVELFYWIL